MAQAAGVLKAEAQHGRASDVVLSLPNGLLLFRSRLLPGGIKLGHS
jgi:hypothetical protein